MKRSTRLKALEEENATLKRLLAEQILDTAPLPELLKKIERAAAKRDAVARQKAVVGLSERSRSPDCRLAFSAIEMPSSGRRPRYSPRDRQSGCRH